MLDFAALNDALVEDLTEALSGAARGVAALASAKAPVRRIFAGGRRVIRFKTASEVEGDRALRRSLGLGPEFAAPKRAKRPGRKNFWARTVERGNPTAVPFRPLERKLTASGRHLAARSQEARLSRRGRYELRSGRAAHKGYLGGRLRDEIYATSAEVEGETIVAEVISPTPYAKYQEFGTRHNPAHPFLRPALHESAPDIAGAIARAVGDVAKRGIPASGTIVVRVIL